MRFGKKKSKDVKTKPSVEDTNKNEEQTVETVEKTTKLNDQLIIDENDENTKKSAKDSEKESKKKEKKDKKASKV